MCIRDRPYLLSYFLQTLYGMADLFLVPSSMLSLSLIHI